MDVIETPYDINYDNINVEARPSNNAEEIDLKICREIDRITAEDINVWSCPSFNRRHYAHSFFQYPAMMIPAVQKKLIEIFIHNDPKIKNIIDPFMGSGTTLVTCMEYGLDCYGQDINPLAVLIAKVKTDPQSIALINDRYLKLVENIKHDKSEKIEIDFANINKWFKKEVLVELSKIVRHIKQESQESVRRFYWVILAETVRLSSNDRTSTFKLHIRSKEEIEQRKTSPIDIYISHLKKSLKDFNSLSSYLQEQAALHNKDLGHSCSIKIADSKLNVFSPGNEEYYDLLITSPPYGDNKTTVTYGQHSYLPLQWIDLKDIDWKVSNSYIQTTSEIDSRSLGGKITRENNIALEYLFNISPTFKETYQKIFLNSPEKVKKVLSFIVDLNKAIDNIYSVMKVNSYQIWTVGNRRVDGIVIPNSDIINEIMDKKGIKLVKQFNREILSKRMAKRNKDSLLMNSEDILIFRKIG